MTTNVNPNLPILDYAQFGAGGDAREQFLKDLRFAAHEIGFFYLKNHGISQELIAEAQALSKAFFALPLAQKKAIHMSNFSIILFFMLFYFSYLRTSLNVFRVLLKEFY